jgi:hypothetical protein
MRAALPEKEWAAIAAAAAARAPAGARRASRRGEARAPRRAAEARGRAPQAGMERSACSLKPSRAARALRRSRARSSKRPSASWPSVKSRPRASASVAVRPSVPRSNARMCLSRHACSNRMGTVAVGTPTSATRCRIARWRLTVARAAPAKTRRQGHWSAKGSASFRRAASPCRTPSDPQGVGRVPPTAWPARAATGSSAAIRLPRV